MQPGPTIRSLALAVVCVGFLAPNASAGPLIDWLFGRNRAAPAYPVGQAVPLGNSYSAGYGVYPNQGYQTNYGNYYGQQLPVIGQYGAGYAARPNGGITAATLPPTANYLPNYRTNSYRAPVTYYRPVLTTDPATGAQVVRMAPCTSYEYQTGRTRTPGRTAYAPGFVQPPLQPAPQALPTYTLPSGGIPLAGQTTYGPRTLAYGAYNGYPAPNYAGSFTQPNFPTRVYGSAPFAAGAGNCTGGYIPPGYSPAPSGSVPGLYAPPAGPAITPSETYGQPTSPPAAYPGDSNSSPTFPPQDTSGNTRPILPQDFQDGSASRLRPELRGIQQSPASESPPTNPFPSESLGEASNSVYPSGGTSSLLKAPTLHTPSDTGTSADYPGMAPIPVPSNFDVQKRWKPGLLKEEDMTTSNLREYDALRFAGASKKIHWASFEQTEQRQVAKTTRPDAVGGLRSIHRGSTLQLSEPVATIRKNERFPDSQFRSNVPQRVQVAPRQKAQPAPANRYDSRGWQSSR